MPVLVILTGQEDGLSAPITFETLGDKVATSVINGRQTARMTLEIAIGFVVALEEREDAAFGEQPDPFLSTANTGNGGPVYCPLFQKTAKKLGWGNEQLLGPSS
ncbi:hypothetical protein NKR23_g5406 [Pleurostoma richardsiae]|jgi:hypothetical protein|uniref:Uncharacterized protein n=1 Tax=Pleurostoma richardsiae TaxID=41990 RepID=A0AA38RT90_9PEZI|nr:hypothetical protein NKR23_g5406 [Pleurostoma richardsiae]